MVSIIGDYINFQKPKTNFEKPTINKNTTNIFYQFKSMFEIIIFYLVNIFSLSSIFVNKNYILLVANCITQ